MDVFYKIKALSDSGVSIILHCFVYGRNEAHELEKYCSAVHYYEREPFWYYFFDSRPFIVASRANPKLLENLANDDFPILFEGIHTCEFLGHPRLAQKKQWVRMHNQEVSYYSQLAKQTTSWWKKMYYLTESNRIRKYESTLSKASGLLTISPDDTTYFKTINPNAVQIGAFHGFTMVTSLVGLGDYVLYHGNLSVAENETAANWILNNLNPETPLVIAGNKPSKRIISICEKRSHTRLVISPSSSEMESLIKQAQIILLPTFQDTGVKLKLLTSLFQGRHVLANPEMVQGTGLKEVFEVFQNSTELNNFVRKWIYIPFDADMVQARTEELAQQTDQIKVDKIIHLMGSENM